MIENAVSEATQRGDGFNAKAFESERRGQKSALPPASVSSMLLYLFAWQPAVVPSMTQRMGSPLGCNRGRVRQ